MFMLMNSTSTLSTSPKTFILMKATSDCSTKLEEVYLDESDKYLVNKVQRSYQSVKYPALSQSSFSKRLTPYLLLVCKDSNAVVGGSVNMMDFSSVCSLLPSHSLYAKHRKPVCTVRSTNLWIKKHVRLGLETE